MYDRKTIMHLVEDAERARPYCFCGAHMIARERDGALRLECAAPRNVGPVRVGAASAAEVVEMGESRTPRPKPVTRTHYERVRCLISTGPPPSAGALTGPAPCP